MTEAVLTGRLGPGVTADKALKAAATLWFLVATLGQWIFVFYVLAYYGPLILQGGLEALSETQLPNGFVRGDTPGNVAVAAHLFLAVVIIGGGSLQLIPQVRARFPNFHRRLGRIYILTAVTSSIAGIYIIWMRGSIGDMLQHVAITLDGVLIIIFAGIAIRYAIARDIKTHRRWALRLFMVASGVWFFRIGFMGWVFLTGGVGIDFESFTGPFLSIWTFGQFLLPLAVLEIYLRSKDRAGAAGRMAMAAGLFALTIAMSIGIYAATTSIWLPKL